MLVDDDSFNIFSLKLLLQSLGNFEIHFASNGKQAIQNVKDLYEKNQFYSLIIMDINMPIMDGVTATKELRSLHE